jgi:hypothetical protein
MKSYCLVLLFIGSTIPGLSQVVIGGNNAKPMDMNTRPGGFITELKKSSNDVKGDTYLNKDWLPATITLIDETVLPDKLIKYNLKEDYFEIRMDNTIKAINGRNVKSFVIANELTQGLDMYVQGKDFLFNGVRLNGFLKTSPPNKWSLLVKTDAVLKPSNYNPVLDIGEEESEYIKTRRLFIAEGNSVFEVNQKSKKKFSQLFDENSEKVFFFLEKNKISLKEESGLRSLIDFLNEI